MNGSADRARAAAEREIEHLKQEYAEGNMSLQELEIAIDEELYCVEHGTWKDLEPDETR